MGWRLDGRSHLDFTVEEMERVTATLGVPWHHVDPFRSLTDAHALLSLDRDADAVTLGDLEALVAPFDGDDLPTEFADGIPVDGRPMDPWIVWAAFKFGWPPDVTRRQTLRDLRLLNESIPDDDD